MKNINLKTITASTLGISMALVFTMLSVGQANAAITSSQMGIGSRGQQVTELQQFLATNSKIYPEGLTTGYYGALTELAVKQFQANYDIAQVGNVGPMTLARINTVINSGLGLDISAPVISHIVLQTGRNTSTISWNTDTQANGKVFYSNTPLQMQEAQTSFTAPYVNGSVAQGTIGTYSQSIVLQNLQSNTTYYYLVESIDASGNVSVNVPGTFTTTN